MSVPAVTAAGWTKWSGEVRFTPPEDGGSSIFTPPEDGGSSILNIDSATGGSAILVIALLREITCYQLSCE
jgi:hypothetical protein